MQIDRNNIEDLPFVISEIHDKWFSVDQIQYDQSQNEFLLFYGDTKKKFDKYLKIRGVRKYEIKDTEKIGEYDINSIIVNLSKSTIIIEGCIPITITLEVDSNFVILIGQDAL